MNLHWGCHEINFLPNLDSEHISCLVAETKCKIFWILLAVQSWFLIDFGTCKGVCNKCEIFKAKSWQYHWGIIVWRWTLESCKSLELIDITWYKTWYSTDINLNGYGSLTHSLARTQKREFSGIFSSPDTKTTSTWKVMGHWLHFLKQLTKNQILRDYQSITYLSQSLLISCSHQIWLEQFLLLVN